MRAILIPATVALAITAVASSSTPAPAAGCLKGAVIGGVAGHYVGHHGLLGAGARCVIGHHEAKKHAASRPRSRAIAADLTRGPAVALPTSEIGTFPLEVPTVAGPLRAAWSRPKRTDLVPGKGQFR